MTHNLTGGVTGDNGKTYYWDTFKHRFVTITELKTSDVPRDVVFAMLDRVPPKDQDGTVHVINGNGNGV